MKRRIFLIATILLLVFVLVFAVACNRKETTIVEPDKTIVFLGDSIAEALIGPSPLSERDNYGYYALLGRTNNFKYYNHSVSGHKTSGSMMPNSGGFLDLLQREGENAALMKTHIKKADIIHISILGNNLLQYDLGLLMLEVADPEFERKYEAGKTAESDEDKTLINLLHDGGETTRESLDTDANGNHRTVKFDFPNTYQDICGIVDELRALNKDAKIFFQKVYNPVFGGSKFLYPELISALAKIDDDGRFGAEGTKIATIEQVRAVAQELLKYLNGMLDEYLLANPDSIVIIDANKAFDDYAKRDVRDGKAFFGTLESEEADCMGANLMFTDWKHPSNLGHAVLAAATQAKFEELALASQNALGIYKQIKVEQINRMYKGLSGFDSNRAISNINSASTYQGVTDAYFEAINGFVPRYSSSTQSVISESDRYFENDILFTISGSGKVAGIPFSLASILLDDEESYFTFRSDGKIHGQIMTQEISVLLAFAERITGIDIASYAPQISSLDLDEVMIKPYVEAMFPGFTLSNIKDSFDLIKNSIGLSLIGVDFEHPLIKAIEEVQEDGTHRIPENFLDELPEDFAFGIAFDGYYHIEMLTDADGNTYQALYIGGDVAHNPNTQPFMILTLSEKKGKKQINLDVEFLVVNLLLVEQI